MGAEAFVPSTRTEQIGIYTFQKVDFAQWHVEAAARYEHTDHTNNDLRVAARFDTLSVSAGVNVDLNETWRLGGTVFRSERAPSTEELFSNGPHLATRQFELGDTALDIETATGIEAVARLRGVRGSVTFNAFYTSYQDYIYEQNTGLLRDGLAVSQFSPANAVFQGAEIAGAVNLPSVGKFDASADLVVELVEVELDVTGNDNLPRIPPLGVLVGLDLKSDRMSVRGEVDFNSRQTSVSRNELPTDAYTQVNIFATFQPVRGDDNLKLRLSLLNLTDEEARQHTSFLKETVPLPGKNIRLSLEARF